MTRYKFTPKYGKDHPRWKGGRRKIGTHILILSPDHPHANARGYVYEHRLVMEQKLGRFLDPKEIVHHINGDTLDNRPENLQVFHRQGDHNRLHFAGVPHNYSNLGRKIPKISEALRGKHHSEEWKRHISEGLKGNPKVSEAKRGKHLSEEWKRHISKGLRTFFQKQKEANKLI